MQPEYMPRRSRRPGLAVWLGACGLVATGCATPSHTVTVADVLDRQRITLTDTLYPFRCTAGAHRGASVEHTENTMEAIRAAEADERYAFIEFDVQYTRDGRIVLFHDKLLLRLFGSMRSVGNTDYEELERITDGAIATFDEVMDIVTKKVNIEIKSQGDEEEDARLVDEVVADIRARGRERDVMISSISPEVVLYLGTRYPEIPRGRIFWLTSSTYLHFDALTEGLYREFESTPADYLMLHVANLRNLDDLLRLKPPDKTIVFWDFDDTMYIVHKDATDRIWGVSRMEALLEHIQFMLFGPEPEPHPEKPLYRGSSNRFS